jgi:hypothetical protein
MTDAQAVAELEFLDDFLNARIPNNPTTMARAENADVALRHAIQVLKGPTRKVEMVEEVTPGGERRFRDSVFVDVQSCAPHELPKVPSTTSGRCGCDGPTRIDPNCPWHGSQTQTVVKCCVHGQFTTAYPCRQCNPLQR